MNEWVWSIGGMILTRETEVLGEKHYTVCVVDEWMSMEHWWNDTDRGNWSVGRKTLYSVCGRWMNEYGALVEWYRRKYKEKSLYQCKFVHHKSDMDFHGSESVPPQWRPENVWVTEHHQPRHMSIINLRLTQASSAFPQLSLSHTHTAVSCRGWYRAASWALATPLLPPLFCLWVYLMQ